MLSFINFRCLKLHYGKLSRLQRSKDNLVICTYSCSITNSVFWNKMALNFQRAVKERTRPEKLRSWKFPSALLSHQYLDGVSLWASMLSLCFIWLVSFFQKMIALSLNFFSSIVVTSNLPMIYSDDLQSTHITSE